MKQILVNHAGTSKTAVARGDIVPVFSFEFYMRTLTLSSTVQIAGVI